MSHYKRNKIGGQKMRIGKEGIRKLKASLANIALILSIFSGMTLVLISFSAPTASATTWDVYPGPGTPIQDAISFATAGDTILVHAGLYNETITIDKTLTIIGDSKTNTTIDAQGLGTVITISASWVNVTGFT
jgi:nitrous oxidase accessory protein NosD